MVGFFLRTDAQYTRALDMPFLKHITKTPIRRTKYKHKEKFYLPTHISTIGCNILQESFLVIYINTNTKPKEKEK